VFGDETRQPEVDGPAIGGLLKISILSVGEGDENLALAVLFAALGGFGDGKGVRRRGLSCSGLHGFIDGDLLRHVILSWLR
jgi:hypothetical protein